MVTFQLIRSATVKVTYNNITFLIDPMLGSIGSFESYGGIQKNPIVNLPLSIDEILKDVDAVLITHLHKDHFDDQAKKSIPKDIPIFCQPGDRKYITEYGFNDVKEIKDLEWFHKTSIHRVGGKHGRGAIEKLMGSVSGFILESFNEPTIYIVGDCVFNEDVKSSIDNFQPDIIICNSGGAFIPGYEQNLILMDEKETIQLLEHVVDKQTQVIPVHLEALDHCTVSRAGLKRALLQSNLNNERVLIPLDGERITFRP